MEQSSGDVAQNCATRVRSKYGGGIPGNKSRLGQLMFQIHATKDLHRILAQIIAMEAELAERGTGIRPRARNRGAAYDAMMNACHNYRECLRKRCQARGIDLAPLIGDGPMRRDPPQPLDLSTNDKPRKRKVKLRPRVDPFGSGPPQSGQSGQF